MITKTAKKLKIAFFTETYLPNIDGVVIAIVNIRKELERAGHKVSIFASGDDSAKKSNKDKDTFYYPSIPFAPYPQYKIAIFTHGARAEVEREDVDIIHSHGMGPMGMVAIYCSKMLHKPVVGTLHTNVQDATHYITSVKAAQEVMKELIWRYLNVYYNQCDTTIVPSKAIAELCRKNGIKNVEIVPAGIDINRFKPGKKRERSKRINALYLGRLVKEKNLDVLIKSSLMVAERVKDIHFTIVGGGPAEEYYKSRVREEGVGHLFTFAGSVKPEEVLGYYHDADIFVFPSIFETQGLSGLEAMACGLPVAGADYLAIPDFVKDGYNGYLFDPFDVDDCAEKIVKTIKDRKKLRKGAIATGRRYSLKRCTADLVKIYYMVLKRNPVKKEKKGRINEGLDSAREKVDNLMESIKRLKEKIRI